MTDENKVNRVKKFVSDHRVAIAGTAGLVAGVVMAVAFAPRKDSLDGGKAKIILGDEAIDWLGQGEDMIGTGSNGLTYIVYQDETTLNLS